MKKHLEMPPLRFESLGVEVSLQVEEVVRHTLEKDVFARTPSVEALVAELREAVNSAVH